MEANRPRGRFRAGALMEHGLTRQEAKDFTEGKSCEICGRSDTRIVVDHCHKTMVIRGALCVKCNVGLHYVENTEWLSAALRYLS